MKDAGAANATGLAKRLEQDFAGVTRDALEQLAAEAEKAAKENAERAALLKQEVTKVAGLREGRARTAELEKKQSTAAELRGKESEIASQRQRVEDAKRASPLLPLIDAATEAQQTAVEEEERIEELKKTLLARERAKRRRRGTKWPKRGRPPSGSPR